MSGLMFGYIALCSFVVWYIVIVAMSFSEWYGNRKEAFEAFFLMAPTLSLICTAIVMMIVGISLPFNGGFSHSQVYVSEMIVQDVNYKDGKLILLDDNEKTLELYANQKWEKHTFPIGIKYIITHQEGHMLSCYPKETTTSSTTKRP